MKSPIARSASRFGHASFVDLKHAAGRDNETGAVGAEEGLQAFRFLLMLASAALLNCVGSEESANEHRNEARALTPRSFALSASAHKEIGQDCATGAGKECKSGLCLRTLAPNGGVEHFCSERCDAARPCDTAGFHCVAILPKPGATFCFPQREAKGSVTPPNPTHWVASDLTPTSQPLAEDAGVIETASVPDVPSELSGVTSTPSSVDAGVQ